MLLNGGTYGGRRYLSSGVVRMFTSRQPGSHRGLGFDMQAYKAICAKSASPKTYGHTGFTGTCVWVDPDKEMVFVFLSNRVHPSAKNWRLNTMQVRQRVHQAVYDALEAGFGEGMVRVEA
jgi:CubicO group peptidase (beta-lactamase class C family)